MFFALSVLRNSNLHGKRAQRSSHPLPTPLIGRLIKCLMTAAGFGRHPQYIHVFPRNPSPEFLYQILTDTWTNHRPNVDFVTIISVVVCYAHSTAMPLN